MNQPPILGIYSNNTGIAPTAAYTEIFEARAPTQNDTNYPIQKRWFDTATNVEYILLSFTSFGGLLQAVWQPLLSGSSAITLTGQSGSALTPIANNFDIYGSSVGSGSTPVRTVGSGNIITTQVQTSQAIAMSNASNIGLSAFNSSQFNVDGNGFVTLVNPNPGLTLTTEDGSVLSPSAGNWNIYGNYAVAGTTPVTTTGSGSTATVKVQTSQAIASTNASNIGLSAFNSSYFTVDMNGFVGVTLAPAAQVVFVSQLSATVNNVTGDSTDYTVIFGNAIENVGSAYNAGTGVFTAPIAGYYLFTANVLCGEFTTSSQTEAIVSLITSGISYKCNQLNPYAVASNDNAASIQVSFQVNQIVHMALHATAHIQIFVGPGGVGNPKNIGVILGGATDPRTYFSGALLFTG